MPIYTYVCEKGHQFDRFLKLADYKEPQTCECGAKSKRKIMPTMLNCDIQPWDVYVSPATGEYITSYKQRREDMARSGCVDYDPGMKDVQKRTLAEQDKKLDAMVDETVERTFDAMPSSKKEKLENELKYLTTEYTRETPK